MKKFVIIVAAGTGKRFGNKLPKQFELLCGRPMLMYPVETFFKAETGICIIVVIPKNYMDQWKELCLQYNFNIPHVVIAGGPERFHSVKNGLGLIDDEGMVAIHDGARPLVSCELIRNAFHSAEKSGAVIPVVGLNDSVRIVTGPVHKAFERNKLRLVQTPQVFKCSVLKSAYQQQYQLHFTDDATVAEAAGEKVTLIEGSTENIKVTNPQDLTIAEALLNAKINML